MNAPSPWLRPLAALAVVLGVTDAALLLTWSRREPSLPPVAAVASDAPAAAGTDPAAVATGAEAAPAAVAPANGAPVDAASAASPTAVLYGIVTQSDGTPVQRGVLWIQRDGEHAGMSSPEGGVYVFAGLRPGEYRITSRIDDVLPLSRTVQVDAPSTRLDLRLDPRWVLQVHAVTPAGQPLTEALGKVDPMLGRIRSLAAAAFAMPLQGDLPLSDSAEVTAGLGPFRRDDPFGRGAMLEKKTVGVLALPPDQPVHVALLLRSVVIAQQVVTPDQTEVTFTLDPAQLVSKTATVKLRVVDATGAPVKGCNVALNDAQSGGGGKPTGDDGRFEVSHLVPGRLRLSIMHKDLQGPPLSIDVPPGAELDLGDVTLQRGIEVAFDGKAMGERGSVSIAWLDAPPQPGFTTREVYLSTDRGAALRAMLFPGRHAVRATAGQRTVMTEIDTRALPAQPIRLDLQPGAPLRLRGGRAGSSVGVEIRAANGAWIHRRSLWGEQDYTMLLPTGTYSVDLVDAAGARTHRTIALSRDGAVLDLP